jgi:hypothetical protein
MEWPNLPRTRESAPWPAAFARMIAPERSQKLFARLLAGLFACLAATAPANDAPSVGLTLNVPQNGMEGTTLIGAGTVSKPALFVVS